jgi:hypothetical protein
MVTFETWGFGDKICFFITVTNFILFFVYWYCLNEINQNKINRIKKITEIFAVSYLLIVLVFGIPLGGLYIYTHIPVSNIVPPIIYIRIMDGNNLPVQDASCFADIETKEGHTDDKPLENIEIFRELECYGRENCPRENYLGYYRLNVTDTSFREWNFLFFKFWKLNKTIKGDFNISIVCRTPISVAYYVFNKKDFPCSPIPLEGNYIAPSFYCSDKNELTDKHAYEMSGSEFDEYDLEAINFLGENYKDEIILANNKLSIAIDFYNMNKPVGIIQDKKGYGDPYVFNEFMISDCERRMELINQFNIDLILSRFELDKCYFMEEIYNYHDYIYNIKK